MPQLGDARVADSVAQILNSALEQCRVKIPTESGQVEIEIRNHCDYPDESGRGGSRIGGLIPALKYGGIHDFTGEEIRITGATATPEILERLRISAEQYRNAVNEDMVNLMGFPG